MEAYQALLSRRSIRKYTSKKIPKETVEEIIKAAMYAPSASNQQPWEFIAIDKRSLLEKIPSFDPHAQMSKEAPLGILVCGKTENIPAEKFWPQDCAAATQNLLLAAHSQGIGSVWTGVYPKEELMKGFIDLLSLPETIVPFAYIVLGYPEKKPFPKERFIKERIHYNQW